MYSPKDLAQAIETVTSKKQGVNEASRQYGVPARTLRRHLTGGVTTRRGPAPTLTPQEEEAIVDGLIERSRKGYPATRLHLAGVILDVVSDGRPNRFPADGPSRKWVAGFLERHGARITMRKARILDSSRIDAVSEDEILMFFAEYEDFLSTHPMDATLIYNCDETGVDPQGGSPMKIIGQRGAKHVSIRRGSNRENTSVLTAVSAAGVMIPPLFIFKGKRIPSNLLHGAPAGSTVTVSENAFIDTAIFDQWIDHFIANIPPARPVLLTLDNHSAHVALSVRRKCIANGIHILSFPPHSTHILQPLDAACFRSFKAHWRKVVDQWALETLGRSIERKDRARLIGQALTLAMTPTIVQNSWQSTGIWPPNQAAIDRDVLSRDTVAVSRFSRYVLKEDVLPVGNLQGRCVRRLARDGIDLGELRCYKLTVKDVEKRLTLEEKKGKAKRTLIEIGPQRLLTHEHCMKAEELKEETKREEAENKQMKTEDAMCKKLRTTANKEERLAGQVKRRLLAAGEREVKAKMKAVKAAARAKEKASKADARALVKGAKAAAMTKLKLRKTASSEYGKPSPKRRKTSEGELSTPRTSRQSVFAHLLCSTCLTWHHDAKCPVGACTVV